MRGNFETNCWDFETKKCRFCSHPHVNIRQKEHGTIYRFRQKIVVHTAYKAGFSSSCKCQAVQDES